LKNCRGVRRAPSIYLNYNDLMDRKGNPTGVLLLVVAVVAILILGAWFAARSIAPRPVSVQKVNFLSEGGPIERYVSGIEDSLQGDGEPFEFPGYIVGDIADPRFIRHDFHVIPDGYRAVDHTLRRVLTMNREFEVVGVLDRSQSIPDGIWQDIHAFRVDSSGNDYLLDRDKNLVQILDTTGHYLRRHTDLGLDLFGTTLEPDNIFIDRLDRLWITGPDRTFVIDRYGNLQRIFERRGAPFNRPQSAIAPAPTEQTPRGYTVLSSSNPLLGTANPEEPFVLETSEFESFIPGGLSDPQLFYISQNGGQEILIFDWDGNERGIIDVLSMAPGDGWQFVTGPDGYLYLIVPQGGAIFVMDPLGEEVKVISVDGLPLTGWLPQLSPTGFGPLKLEPKVRAFVDFEGRLVIYDTENSDIRIYALREEHLEAVMVPD